MSRDNRFVRATGPLAMAITGLWLAAPNVTAQSAIEEIVVTAQFREERLQDTPIAITAVSDDMMRARSQTAIYEVTQQAPNVEIKRNSGPFGSATSAFIRGIGQGDFNFAREPGVGMYIDDVYFATMTGSAFEIVDLERIEILRGPQGTLSGRNSIGGAVRLITRKPTGDGPGYLEVTTGKYGRIGGRAAGEFSLTDNLAARVSVAGNSQNGYVDRLDFACHQPTTAAALGIVSQGVGKADCKLGTLGGQSYVAGRATLAWTATDALSITLIGDITNDDSEATAMVLANGPVLPVVLPPAGSTVAIGATPNSSFYGPWFNTPDGEYYTYETFTDPTGAFTGQPFATSPINHFYGWGLAGIIDYTVSDNLAFKSITSYRELNNDFSTAHDGSPLNGETGYNELFGHSWQQEIRANGAIGGVDYTIGGFYFTQENTNRNRIDIGYLPFAMDFISEEVADSTSWALFGHAVWHATDRLNLTAGIRYSDEEKDQLLGRLNSRDGGQTGSDFFLFAALLPSGYPPIVTFEDDRVDYRVSIDYRWTDEFMTYATHSTGYKSGGVSPRFFQSAHIVPYGVEDVRSYEIGFKADLFDRQVRVNVAGFLNDYEDQQTGAPNSDCTPFGLPAGPCLADFNLWDSEYWGGEVEVNWYPTENTIIDLSASTISAKYTRLPALTAADPLFRTNPDAPAGIPQYKFSAGIQHAFALPGGGSLTPRIDVNYEANRKPTTTNLMTTPGFTVVNARLTWRSADDKWEASGAVTNLTDKYYFHNVFDISAFGGWAAAQPAEPIEWSLTLRRNF